MHIILLSILNSKLIVWPTASRLAVQRFSVTPYITPRFTPSGTPKITSTVGSPRGYSAVASPTKPSGATSTKSVYDGRGGLSSWYPSSQQSSAANSPPRARPLPGSEELLLFSSILRIIIIL